MIDVTALARFEQKVQYCPTSGCWLWEGAANPKGYGMFRFSGGPSLAHRAAYRIFRNEIPPTALVLHRCDTPACVNPDHLFVGTAAQNTGDMINKGRMGTRLTQRAAIGLLLRHLSGETINCFDVGQEIGVSNVTVWKIITGRAWKHLPRNKDQLMKMVAK